MDAKSGSKMYLALYVIVFLAAVFLISGGKIDGITLTSAPILLASQAMVFGMLYLVTYHSENH